MKKLMLGMLLCCLACTQLWIVKAKEIDTDITAEKYIVMDRTSGNILLEKNAQETMEPASMTKIMTAIIVIENTRDFDRLITLTKSDIDYVQEKSASRVGLMKVGDQLSINDALYGLMLASGGDCGMMLSHSVTGTREEFIELMNKKAEAIGLYNTHFQNALGTSEKGQYSTAEDIARLLQYAMKNEHLKEIMNTASYTLKPTLSEPIEITHSASVAFKAAAVPYDAIKAAKTGYEVNVGHCLAALVEKEGIELISVVVGSGMEKEKNVSAQDTKALTDFVFNETQIINLSVEELKEHDVFIHSDQYDIQEPISFLIEKDVEPKQFQYTYHDFDTEEVVFAGKQVGELEVHVSEDTIISVPVYASKIHSAKKNLFLYGALLVFATLYFTYQHKRHQAVLKGGKVHG